MPRPFHPPLTNLPPLQIINTTVNANFHPMFAAALVGSLVSQSTVGWLVSATMQHTPHTTTLLTIAQQLGLASLLGPALAVLRMPMVAREGTAYYLVRRQFLFKVSAPCCDHFLGPLLSHRRAPHQIALCCIAAWLGSTSMVGVLGFVVIHQGGSYDPPVTKLQPLTPPCNLNSDGFLH